MDVAEYGRIADAEEVHWWYRGTRALMRQLLAPWLRPGIESLDAGCGPGGNAAWLLDYGPVTGVDHAPEAVRLARERHPRMRIVEGDVTALPFEDDSFDVVVAITVLYQVVNDRAGVGEMARVLRPGGALLVIEPAMPSLWRDHDEVVMGRRRYDLAGLREIVAGAGLEVRRATGAYAFLVPPAAALARWHRIRPGAATPSSDLERPRFGSMFGALAATERRALRRRDLRFGVSAAVLAEGRDRPRAG